MIQTKVVGLKTNIDIEELNKMPPSERKRHIRTILLKIVNKNENGITVPTLEKLTSFDQRTISKHMEFLTAIREAYKLEMGNQIIYYPNGKLMHPSDNIEKQIGDKFYKFSLIENNIFGKFLYIQEREKDIFNAFVVKGGLVVEQDKINEFIESLKEVESHGNRQHTNLS
jgi:hypothetical protein